MPSSDTSSGSWSESDAEESTSSSSLANDASSFLEGSSLSTDEEFGSTAEGEEVDAGPRATGNIEIVYSEYTNKEDFFDYPVDSSNLKITMSDRPHRQGKPNKKYLGHDYLGDESLPTTPSASDSSSDCDTSTTIPKGQSPDRSNARPISSTPKRKRRRHEYSQSGRFERQQRKRSDWTIAGIKTILLNQRELKAEMAALREEVRRLTASNPLPSASETPIVQRVCTLGAYDELTAEVSDTSYRRNLVAYLSAMGGGRLKAGTRGLFDSPVYSVILEVFNRWNKDHHSDRQQLENAFKNAFKKGHDRYQRKCHRASQSRQSKDPSSNITEPADYNGEEQA
ncbi:hypothetical protein SprV_0200559400 [Sparganum proliferum]